METAMFVVNKRSLQKHLWKIESGDEMQSGCQRKKCTCEKKGSKSNRDANRDATIVNLTDAEEEGNSNNKKMTQQAQM